MIEQSEYGSGCGTLADLSPETVHEVVEAQSHEFKPLLDGDEPGCPLPLRGSVGGRNKFMGATIPRYEKKLKSGIVVPEEAQVRTNACQIVKLCRDIATWEQDKPDCFRELSEIRDRYRNEYDTGGLIEEGMVVTYIPGNCQVMPFPCDEPDPEDPKFGWLNRFWSPKGIGNRYPGIEFVAVHAGAVLNWLQFYTFAPARSTWQDDAAAARRVWTLEGSKPELIERSGPSIIMAGGGLSPNRM